MNTANTPTWDMYFISLAHLAAMRSKDTSTKVGAVIVGPDYEIRTTGYNGFPRKLNDTIPERYIAPHKYMWTEHAERNAIYNAARCGISLKNCVLYVTWFPCHDCARAIISVGVTKVVVHKDFEVACPASDNWDDSHKVSKEMLAEAGIEIAWYEGPVINVTPLKGGVFVDLGDQ